MDDLLRSISWHAEKQIRRRGNFPSVLWLTLDVDGMRKMYDTLCVNAPDAATDAELLDGLATDFAIDLSEAPTRVVKFAVAYAGNRVTTFRPLDPASMQPKTVRRKGVVIETHGADAHARFFRELLHSSGGRSMLGPVEPLAEPCEGPWRARPGSLAYMARSGRLISRLSSGNGRSRQVDRKQQPTAPPGCFLVGATGHLFCTSRVRHDRDGPSAKVDRKHKHGTAGSRPPFGVVGT